MEISLLADHPLDAYKIAKWYFDEWSSTAPEVTESMVLEKVLDKSVNRHQIPLALVAHNNQELVGVLELKLRENQHYPAYEHWIGGVFVHPDYRGEGVASRLIEQAKATALAQNINTLYLQCESFNVGLYQKQGFKVLHKARHYSIETTIMVWHATRPLGNAKCRP